MPTPRPITEEAALLRLTAQCATTEYCLHDIRRKMAFWLLPEGAVERILQRLLRERYVNEERYARAFARDKFRFNRWGAQRISLELRRRGISDDDIRAGLSEIDEDDSLNTLRDLLRSKHRTVTARSDYERYMKLLRFAVSRGFSIEQARQCLQQDLQLEDEDW